MCKRYTQYAHLSKYIYRHTHVYMYTQCRLSICMCQVYAHINKTYMEYWMVSNKTMPMCRSIKTIDLPKLGMAHQFLGVIRSIAKLRVWKAFQWGVSPQKATPVRFLDDSSDWTCCSFLIISTSSGLPRGQTILAEFGWDNLQDTQKNAGKINEMVSGGFSLQSIHWAYPLVI